MVFKVIVELFSFLLIVVGALHIIFGIDTNAYLNGIQSFAKFPLFN